MGYSTVFEDLSTLPHVQLMGPTAMSKERTSPSVIVKDMRPALWPLANAWMIRDDTT